MHVPLRDRPAEIASQRVEVSAAPEPAYSGSQTSGIVSARTSSAAR